MFLVFGRTAQKEKENEQLSLRAGTSISGSSTTTTATTTIISQRPRADDGRGGPKGCGCCVLLPQSLLYSRKSLPLSAFSDTRVESPASPRQDGLRWGAAGSSSWISLQYHKPCYPHCLASVRLTCGLLT